MNTQRRLTICLSSVAIVFLTQAGSARAGAAVACNGDGWEDEPTAWEDCNNCIDWTTCSDWLTVMKIQFPTDYSGCVVEDAECWENSGTYYSSCYLGTTEGECIFRE